jgi:hypothetical protein
VSKKEHKKHPVWIAALAVTAVGGLAIWAYEVFVATPVLAPGSSTVVTPASGSMYFALPSGSTGWGSATLQPAGGTSMTLQPPLTPSTNFYVSGITKGATLTVTWTGDTTAVTNTSTITFT